VETKPPKACKCAVSDLYKDVKIALRVKRILIQSHIFLIQIVNLKQDLFLEYTTDNV